jgi:hypothetical protein
MLTSPSPPLPQLAPPGAGLPKPELFFARLFFRLSRRSTSREKTIHLFAQYQGEILRLVRSCSPEIAAQRVLIRRLRGLEDSSRYWSVYMTLDHLRIVNLAIASIISSLVAGQVPPQVVSTADVKPDPQVDSSVVLAFEDSCRKFAQVIADSPNLATPHQYAHPWFGPLDAASWHFLAGFHLNLHRKQIERILAGLKTSCLTVNLP